MIAPPTFFTRSIGDWFAVAVRCRVDAPRAVGRRVPPFAALPRFAAPRFVAEPREDAPRDEELDEELRVDAPRFAAPRFAAPRLVAPRALGRRLPERFEALPERDLPAAFLEPPERLAPLRVLLERRRDLAVAMAGLLEREG
jgi:hypothetical protein